MEKRIFISGLKPSTAFCSWTGGDLGVTFDVRKLSFEHAAPSTPCPLMAWVLSIPEIADLTGLDSGTIKSHLFRAAQKIRERLADFQNKA